MTGAETGGITLLEQCDASVVDMWGEIDVALRSEASAALANALDRDLPVVIDTSKVTFMDSTGIAFLVQFYTIGTEEGLEVVLRNPPTVVTDVLEMLGVIGIFPQTTGDVPARSAGQRSQARAG
ncbi:STAS domain-containing protein [Oerskovia flava]|uniref:STAS domain-containing protein n=1 Tax=Oerskovia flava TaxID=2986422 RepID=UPI00223FCB5E|nr:STAS domain-containing protein [Oerskovia sp. JB1-3-2]